MFHSHSTNRKGRSEAHRGEKLIKKFGLKLKNTHTHKIYLQAVYCMWNRFAKLLLKKRTANGQLIWMIFCKVRVSHPPVQQQLVEHRCWRPTPLSHENWMPNLKPHPMLCFNTAKRSINKFPSSVRMCEIPIFNVRTKRHFESVAC